MRPTSQFGRELNAEVQGILKKASKAVEANGLYGWNLVTAGTPVLTGRARASWLLSVDDTSDDTWDEVGGDVRVYDDPVPPSVNFDVEVNTFMYITNNVEYIEYLEEGTEKFAPFSMVLNATPKIDRDLQRRFNQIK